MAETHQGSAPEPEPSHFLFFIGNDFSPWGTELISPPSGSYCLLGLFCIAKTAHAEAAMASSITLPLSDTMKLSPGC